MKLANDALVAIIGVFRKGLTEGMDVSNLLREIDLVPDPKDDKLHLNPDHSDIWTLRS